MIKTKIIECRPFGEYCQTYSTEGKKIKRINEDKIHGCSVIDTIVRYDKDGYPMSGYIYVETDEYDDPHNACCIEILC